jgi:hypothetical protein
MKSDIPVRSEEVVANGQEPFQIKRKAESCLLVSRKSSLLTERGMS